MGSREACTAGMAAALLLLGAASGGCGAGKPASSPTATARSDTSPALPSPLATESLAVGRSGLRIVGVIPPAGARGPWTGYQVIVAYLPAAARVVTARCRLFVDGRRQTARVRRNAISPGQPIIIFDWDAPYPPGSYRLRARLVTSSGARTVFAWSYTSR